MMLQSVEDHPQREPLNANSDLGCFIWPQPVPPVVLRHAFLTHPEHHIHRSKSHVLGFLEPRNDKFCFNFVAQQSIADNMPVADSAWHPPNASYKVFRSWCIKNARIDGVGVPPSAFQIEVDVCQSVGFGDKPKQCHLMIESLRCKATVSVAKTFHTLVEIISAHWNQKKPMPVNATKVQPMFTRLLHQPHLLTSIAIGNLEPREKFQIW